ncbi:MAG: transcription antitermination factor NusB [Eggerthellaceae bacterium]|jgi:N utilization substance protein B|nr:transcription antitermination factor NusB [Denitrobacterium detoxificans]ANE23460.1 antitermination protein NusB [Denitrobacterium detoxificans]MBE6465435.1 transcription antitermination factor NusB [Denitrobacterium detoxificans]MCR5583578.1 transcription antitermination factor NusB [Eggerthellaceae bacterium]
MKKRHERILSRRMAVQVLYQSEITGVPAWEIADKGDALPEGGTLPPYAIELLRGVAAHRVRIDKLLDEASSNWSLERMPLVDRSIMRMAVYEMLHETDVPVSVCINEAVELAKEFGGEDDSSRFVNGVLGRIARDQGLSDDVPEVDEDLSLHRDVMPEGVIAAAEEEPSSDDEQ